MIKNLYSRYYPSLYRGVVESNEDPEGLGRCRVRIPSVHGALTYPVDIIPWARPITQSPIGGSRGSVNIPSKGDIVWVMFEGANKDYPIYIGGTYSNGEDIKINPEKVDFYIDEDTEISYDREKKSYTIAIKDSKIILTKEGITLKGDVKISGDLTVEGTIHNSLFEGGNSNE